MRLQLSRGVRVTALYMYPIKSCAGTRLTVAGKAQSSLICRLHTGLTLRLCRFDMCCFETEFDRLGVVRDRRYLIVDEKNDFLNARLHDYCKMALIQPTFEAAPTGAATLVLTAPGQSPLRVPADWDQRMTIIRARYCCTDDDSRGSICLDDFTEVTVSIWGDKIPAGLFSSPHVSKWLSDFMGIPW